MKNVLQFISTNNGEYVALENKPRSYFKYVYFSLILNMLREGHTSFAIMLLKIIIDNDELDLCETMDTFLFLLSQVYEYDTEFVIEKIYHIAKKYINTNIIDMLINKFNYIAREDIEDNSRIINNIYLETALRFYRIANGSDLNKLIEFRKFCKEKQMKKFKILTDLIIADRYLKTRRITESLYIVIKNLKFSDDLYTKMKCRIMLLRIYFETDDLQINSLFDELQSDLDKIGSIEDKFDYYYIKTQKNIRDNNLDQINILIANVIKYAVYTNNIEKFKNAFNLYQSVYKHEKDFIINKLDTLIAFREKFFFMIKNFKLNQIERIEIIKAINNFNKKFLTELNII
jgi:hypothetical protein